jgi:hypothetical protein
LKCFCRAQLYEARIVAHDRSRSPRHAALEISIEGDLQMETQTNERKINTSSHPEVNWDDLETPGFYVSRATGNGYRVPAEALIKGASPVIEQVSTQPSRLVKVSDNPFVPLIKARNLAANCNIDPNF